MSEILLEQFVGQKIGNYQVDRLLGHGKVNALYEAHHVTQNYSVMLTTFLLPETFSAQARSQFLARFQQESSILLKLSHPHIFPLYDRGEHLGLPYLVNPLHQGTSLSKKLRQQGRLSAEQTLVIFRQIGDAIDLAHHSSVSHGSLGPSNILFTEDDAVLVAGFGLSRILVMRGIDQLGNPPYAHLLNIAGTFLSPPAYLAPEVVQGMPADSRADIFALGILLFELLSGAPPFTGTNPAEVIQQQFQKPMPSLHAQIPTLPAAVDVVIQKALNRQPDQRFQSIGEFVYAFTLAIHDTRPAEIRQPVQQPAPPPLPTEQTTRLLPGKIRPVAQNSPALPPAEIRPAALQPTTRPSIEITLPVPQPTASSAAETQQDTNHSATTPSIGVYPSGPNSIGQTTLPLSVNWLAAEKQPSSQLTTPSASPAASSTPQDPFVNQFNTDSLPGIDPFDWWHSTAQTSMVPPPKNPNKAAANRSAKATSSRKGQPQKQSRRRVVALFATGGLLVLGTAGATSIILPRLLQKKAPQAAASTQSETALQSRPTVAPTPTPAPTATPKPKATATPNPTPTPAPPPPPQHTGTVIASTNMAFNSAHNFTNPANGDDSILVRLASGTFVAYDRLCTHAQVPVDYDPGSKQLVCPAHGATFDPANAASVTNGPADTPLARVNFRLNADGTVTVG